MKEDSRREDRKKKEKKTGCAWRVKNQEAERVKESQGEDKPKTHPQKSEGGASTERSFTRWAQREAKRESLRVEE